MKQLTEYVIVLLASMLCLSGHAQVVSGAVPGEEAPFMFVEEMPEFPGGQDSLTAFLRREIVYPQVARDNGITGTVLVEFVVERDGRVSNGVVKVPLFPDCDVEALRGVMSMPRWKPGRNMGKPVRCFFQIPITFRP